MNTKTDSYSLKTTICNNRIIDLIDDSIENSEIDINSNGTSNITSYPCTSDINLNPLVYIPNYSEYESTSGSYSLQEIYDRLEKLEKYFEKIKKVMPWVPDENGEYK